MRYKVRCGQLKSNGLRFYTQFDNGSTKEMAVICIMAGSLHDPKRYRGLAHLVEHVITGEAREHNEREVALLFARTMGGPDDNIFITTDRTPTTYGPGDLIRKHHNRKLFHIFASMVKEPVFSSKILSMESTAVLQEHYLRGEDIIEQKIFDLLYELTFPAEFPARNPIDGSMEEVRKATLQTVKIFHNQYYVPKNAFVIYLGPKHEEARRIIESELGDWGVNWKSNRNRETGFFLGKNQGGFKALAESVKKELVSEGSHQYHTAVGFSTETYMTDDAEALDVLAQILSDRMYRKLRTENEEWQKGAYRTPVYTDRSFAHGIFYFHFATTDEQFSKYGIEVFREECKKISEELTSRDELEAWIGYLYDYEFFDNFQRSPGRLMEMVASAVANGDTDLEKLHARGEKLKSFLQKGGRQKLREVAQKYLLNHSATVISKPK